ncbi:MAG: shikimate dehydrogenase [Pseudomonadota bacterium]
MTALYGVIGDPIEHSLSPLIHRGWMRDYNVDADYLAMQVPAGNLEDALETLALRGCKGANITLPHKEDAFRLSNRLSETARRIGAVNTLMRSTDNVWAGDNTDAPGFRHALGHAFEAVGTKPFSTPKAEYALVLGAGGASRAVAYVFGMEGQSAVFCNRTLDRAQSLVAIHDIAQRSREKGVADAQAVGIENLSDELRVCSYMVNATSLGHAGKSIDWPEGRGRLAYDLSYGKAADAFLGPAQEAGWRVVDGLRMLVAQAAVSFEIWFGRAPDIDKGFERAARALEGVA